MTNRFCLVTASLLGGLAASATPILAGNLHVGATFNVVDTDGDGIFDVSDNAPYHSNISQMDTDGDQLGDAGDPNISSTDADGDGIIDPIDAQPANGFVQAITYTLGGPYFVSIGQNLAISYTSPVTSYTGYDRLTVSVDGNPNVAKYLITPSSSGAISLSGIDLAALGINTPGAHLLGVESFYDQDSAGGNLEAFTTINVVVPEPTTVAATTMLASALLRRRRR